MNKKFLFTCLSVLALGWSATSCSDDDPVSIPPLFKDMEFAALNGGEQLKASEKVVATAVQERKGDLLYKAKYTWSAKKVGGTSAVNPSHRYMKEVIYDHQNFNPTDTIIFNEPGKYEVAFDSKFFISAANYERIDRTQDLINGTIVYKTPTWQYYTVRITKSVVVK